MVLKDIVPRSEGDRRRRSPQHGRKGVASPSGPFVPSLTGPGTVTARNVIVILNTEQGKIG